jgi:hypothetical protein
MNARKDWARLIHRVRLQASGRPVFFVFCPACIAQHGIQADHEWELLYYVTSYDASNGCDGCESYPDDL